MGLMNSVSKLLKKEEIKAKKNPGTENRRKRQELNKAKRGENIPAQKIVEPKKTKARKRTRLKKDLQKEIRSLN